MVSGGAAVEGPPAAADDRRRRLRAASGLWSPGCVGHSRSLSKVALGNGLLGYSGAYQSTVQAAKELTVRKQIDFLVTMRATDAYKALASEADQTAAEGRVDALCAACWRLCQESTTIEAVSLKGQLMTTSLDSQKQICAMRAEVTHEDQDLIDFYEPLQHVDPVSRDLVLHTVVDKLQQLEDNTAPASLVHKLLDYVRRSKRGGENDEGDFDEEAVEPGLLAELRSQPHRGRHRLSRVPALAIAEFGGHPPDPMARVDRLGRVCEDLEEENEGLREILSAKENELKYRRQRQEARMNQLAEEQHKMAMEARAREEEREAQKGKVTAEMLRRIFEGMDKDGDGEVELKDFLLSTEDSAEVRQLLRGRAGRRSTAGARPRRRSDKSSVATGADGDSERASFALAPDAAAQPPQGASHRTLQKLPPTSAAPRRVSWRPDANLTLLPGDLPHGEGGPPDVEIDAEKVWAAWYSETAPPVPVDSKSGSDDSSGEQQSFEEMFLEMADKRPTLNFDSFASFFERRGTPPSEHALDEDAARVSARQSSQRSGSPRGSPAGSPTAGGRQGGSWSPPAQEGPSSTPTSAGRRSPSGRSPSDGGIRSPSGRSPSDGGIHAARLAMAAAAAAVAGGEGQPVSPSSHQSAPPMGLARPGSAPGPGDPAAAPASGSHRWSLPVHAVSVVAASRQGSARAAASQRSDGTCAAGRTNDVYAEASARSPRFEPYIDSAAEPGGGASGRWPALEQVRKGCAKISLGTQTDVSGDHVSQLQAEVERYASLLKELSDRFGALLPTAKVQQVIKTATSSMPALQHWYVRLYADAQDRDARKVERQALSKEGQVVLLRHWSTPDAREWGGLAVVDTPVAEPRYPELPAAMLLSHQYQRNSGSSVGTRMGQRAPPLAATPTASAPAERGGPERPVRVLVQDEDSAEEAPLHRGGARTGPPGPDPGTAAAESAGRARRIDRPLTSGGARDYRDLLLARGGDGAAPSGATQWPSLAELPAMRPRSAASGLGASRGRRARRSCQSLTSPGALNSRRAEARQDVRVVRPDILAPAR